MSDPVPSLIGVIVPAYNAERWLRATIDTVRAQREQRWHCVIVDDGSTDSTGRIAGELAATDNRIKVVTQTNAGLPAARNSGLRELPAGCDYIAFLDSDDLWEPDTLSSLLAVLRQRPDAVGAYGLADYVDEHGRPMNPGSHPDKQRYRRAVRGWWLRPVPPAADATFAEIVTYGPIWPPAVALQRATAVRAVGGFDTSFPCQEDWDFYVRISRRGPYVALDRRLAWYRRHGSNLSGAHAKNILQQQHVRHNAYSSPQNSAEQARLAARAWRSVEIRQTGILLRHSLRGLRRQAWREAGRTAVGALVCGAQVLRPGPPPPSPRVVRWTRPPVLPEAGLF